MKEMPPVQPMPVSYAGLGCVEARQDCSLGVARQHCAASREATHSREITLNRMMAHQLSKGGNRGSLSRREIPYEKGIETVEWLALAAVILGLLVGLMLVFTPGGRQVATEICREVAT